MKKVLILFCRVSLAIGLVIAITSCASSYPMNGNFASNDIPVDGHSILTSQSGTGGEPGGAVGIGAYITSINGRQVIGKDPRAGSTSWKERFVLPPGNYTITIGYSKTSDLPKKYYDYQGNVTTYTSTTSSVSDFQLDINLLPGHFYEVIGGVIDDTLCYAIIDFTTKELKVAWTTNQYFANRAIVERGAVSNYNRGQIIRSIENNAGLYTN